MMMAIHDSNFIYWDFKMAGHQLQNTAVGHILFGFFFDGNFKMVFGLFLKGFFARAGCNFRMDIE